MTEPSFDLRSDTPATRYLARVHPHTAEGPRYTMLQRAYEAGQAAAATAINPYHPFGVRMALRAAWDAGRESA